MLSTGEMIDSLRVGEKAEVAKYPPYVLNFRKDAYVINDGSRFLWDDGDQFMINNSTKNIKWRIAPQYVSFEEAKKAYEEGKTIKCEFPGKIDGVTYCETFNKREPEDVGALSMYMITEGKWSVEDDS